MRERKNATLVERGVFVLAAGFSGGQTVSITFDQHIG